MLETTVALARLESQGNVLLGGIREALRTRPPYFEEGLFTIVDHTLERESKKLTELDYKPLSLLQGLSDAWPVGSPEPTDGDPTPAAKAVELAMAFERLRLAKYRVRDGHAVAVDDADHVEREPEPFEPPMVLERRSCLWVDWTQIHFGRGPGIEGKAGPMADAVRRQDPRGSLLHRAGAAGLDIRFILRGTEHQAYNYFMPGLTKKLRALRDLDKTRGTHFINSIIRVCEGLDWWAQQGLIRPFQAEKFEGGKGAMAIPAARLDPWLLQLDEPGILGLIDATYGRPPLFPLLLRKPFRDLGGDHYVYSPRLCRRLQMVLASFQIVEGRYVEELAGDEFEKLTAVVLGATGYEPGDLKTVNLGLSLNKKDPKEIDVLCWNDDEVLLVEVKAETEYPGSWSPAGIDARRALLEERRVLLSQKVDAWRAALEGGRRQFKAKGGIRIDLPAGLLGHRTIRGLTLSYRVEPALEGTPAVLTYMPPIAAQLAKERLPLDRLAPIWNEEMGPPS